MLGKLDQMDLVIREVVDALEEEAAEVAREPGARERARDLVRARLDEGAFASSILSWYQGFSPGSEGAVNPG